MLLHDKFVRTDKGISSINELITSETGATKAFFSPLIGIDSSFLELCSGILSSRLLGIENVVSYDYDSFMQPGPPTGKIRKLKPSFLLMDGKGEREVSMCKNTALLALFLLQSKAFAGGRGYMTSPRGGSALSVIEIKETLHKTINHNAKKIKSVEQLKCVFHQPRSVVLHYEDDNLAHVFTGALSTKKTDTRHPFGVYSEPNGFPLKTPPKHDYLHIIQRIADLGLSSPVLVEGFLYNKADPISFFSKQISFGEGAREVVLFITKTLLFYKSVSEKLGNSVYTSFNDDVYRMIPDLINSTLTVEMIEEIKVIGINNAKINFSCHQPKRMAVFENNMNYFFDKAKDSL